MALEWRLRQIMASRGIWSGAELARLMDQKAGYKLSAASISVLLTETPKQIKATTMDALCTALDCTPADLWKHTPSRIKEDAPIQESQAANGSSLRTLPPI